MGTQRSPQPCLKIVRAIKNCVTIMRRGNKLCRILQNSCRYKVSNATDIVDMLLCKVCFSVNSRAEYHHYSEYVCSHSQVLEKVFVPMILVFFIFCSLPTTDITDVIIAFHFILRLNETNVLVSFLFTFILLCFNLQSKLFSNVILLRI